MAKKTTTKKTEAVQSTDLPDKVKCGTILANMSAFSSEEQLTKALDNAKASQEQKDFFLSEFAKRQK
jgi:hypothetical protein